MEMEQLSLEFLNAIQNFQCYLKKVTAFKYAFKETIFCFNKRKMKLRGGKAGGAV